MTPTGKTPAGRELPPLPGEAGDTLQHPQGSNVLRPSWRLPRPWRLTQGVDGRDPAVCPGLGNRGGMCVT